MGSARGEHMLSVSVLLRLKRILSIYGPLPSSSVTPAEIQAPESGPGHGPHNQHE